MQEKMREMEQAEIASSTELSNRDKMYAANLKKLYQEQND